MKKSVLKSCIVFAIILPIIGFSQIEQWVARYNGPDNYDDEAYAIALDNAGNVYVTGVSYGSGTFYDYATVKYDSLGVQKWVARYNGPGNDYDMANAIALDNAGNVYVVGESMGPGLDYATVKYNSSGVEQWVVRYNCSGSSSDGANAIALDNAGNVYVTGWSFGSGTSSDYATVKYNSSGVEQWVKRYDGSANLYDEAYAIAVDNAGNICVTGRSEAWVTYSDYVTIKYDSTGIGIVDEGAISVENSDLGATLVSGPLLLPEGKNCRVYDITGRVVIPDKIRPGIYFIEIDGEITQKVVKVR